MGRQSEGTERTHRVPRIGRVLDLTGAAVFAAGASLYAWAWAGFRRVPGYSPGLEDGAWAAVGLANRYWRLQRIGTALMVAAVGVFVFAWWTAGRRGTTRPDGA